MKQNELMTATADQSCGKVPKNETVFPILLLLRIFIHQKNW